MGQLPTRNPLFLIPVGYSIGCGVGIGAIHLWERFVPRSYQPWEHRYRDAIQEGRIPSTVSLEEFRAKYDDYGHTAYVVDPKRD